MEELSHDELIDLIKEHMIVLFNTCPSEEEALNAYYELKRFMNQAKNDVWG